MLKKQPLGKIRSYLDKGILAFVEALVVRKRTQGGRSIIQLFVGLGEKVKEHYGRLSGSFSLKHVSGRFPQRTLTEASGQTLHPPSCGSPD